MPVGMSVDQVLVYDQCIQEAETSFALAAIVQDYATYYDSRRPIEQSKFVCEMVVV